MFDIFFIQLRLLARITTVISTGLQDLLLE
jgi:hypothetical protein